MTEKEFLKKRWVSYELIEYHGRHGVIDCILLAVDFDERLFKLDPIDKELYEDKSFWCRVDNYKRPNPKLKKVK